jgi:hypothetical protein
VKSRLLRLISVLILVLVFGCSDQSRIKGVIAEFSGTDLPSSAKLMVQEEEWNEINGDGHAYYVFELPDASKAKEFLIHSGKSFKKSSYADLPRKPLVFKSHLKPEGEVHYKLELKGQDFTLLILKGTKLFYFSTIS